MKIQVRELGKHFFTFLAHPFAFNNVEFDIFTWGEGHFHLPQTGRTLTVQRFLDNYLGFIAAKL